MKAEIEFKPEQIQALREGLGLSQAEFGERLDVTRQAVSLWETGTSRPSVETLLKIVNLWGAKLDSFFREAEA